MAAARPQECSCLLTLWVFLSSPVRIFQCPFTRTKWTLPLLFPRPRHLFSRHLWLSQVASQNLTSTASKPLLSSLTHGYRTFNTATAVWVGCVCVCYVATVIYYCNAVQEHFIVGRSRVRVCLCTKRKKERSGLSVCSKPTCNTTLYNSTCTQTLQSYITELMATEKVRCRIWHGR